MLFTAKVEAGGKININDLITHNHDHLFVPASDAPQAMAALRSLQLDSTRPSGSAA